MPDSPLRVLLVEDNDGDADLVQEYIGEVGPGRFMLRRARTLAEAQEVAASEYDPQVILLDLNLPDSKGLDTLDAFCRVPATRRPPIVVLTSLDDEDAAAKALGSCAQDYLVKQDIGARTLIRAVRNAIMRHGRQAVDAMLEAGPDPGAALEVIRRINRTGAGQAVDVPGMARPDKATAGLLMEQQATALRAGEILFAQMEYRVQSLERRSGEREVQQTQILGEMGRIAERLEPLIRIARGNGQGTLASRIDALERNILAEQERERTTHGFRRELIVGIIVVVLGGIGSLIGAIALRAFGV